MDIAVVGAGASGLMAAITAAEYGAAVTIYEYNNEPAKKLLRTGNGKCNISNTNLSNTCFYSDSSTQDSSSPGIEYYLNIFDTSDTISFFRNLGLLLVDNNNYLYPFCGQASVVRELLLDRVRELDINITLNSRISELKRVQNNKYCLINHEEAFYYDRVILSCGSYAGLQNKDRIDSSVDGYSLAYKLGAHILPVKPALSGIITEDSFCKNISGVRASADIRLVVGDEVIAADSGELQFTDIGVSGIPAMNISRFINIYGRKAKLVIDFIPGLGDEEWKALKKGRLLQQQGAGAYKLLSGLINSKLVEALLDRAGIANDTPIEELSNEDIDKLLDSCRELTLVPKSLRGFQHAQVCMGGVSMKDVDKDLSLLAAPGVYIAGEMLDVDCRCGGYNLQWAWTTGHIAGKSAALCV